MTTLNGSIINSAEVSRFVKARMGGRVFSGSIGNLISVLESTKQPVLILPDGITESEAFAAEFERPIFPTVLSFFESRYSDLGSKFMADFEDYLKARGLSLNWLNGYAKLSHYLVAAGFKPNSRASCVYKLIAYSGIKLEFTQGGLIVPHVDKEVNTDRFPNNVPELHEYFSPDRVRADYSLLIAPMRRALVEDRLGVSLADYLGVSDGTVYKLGDGRAQPTVSHLHCVARILKKSVFFGLFGLTSESNGLL